MSIETKDTSATLLELAANNDIEGFKTAIESDPSRIDDVGLWYGRQKGSRQMVLENRTPLMVAAMYGSIDVLKLILSQSKTDVNRLCGVDKTTALHCAASGGSVTAIEAIKLLLTAGADLNLIDVNGLRPVDVIVGSPKFPGMKKMLEEVLRGVGGEITVLPLSEPNLDVNGPRPVDVIVGSPKFSGMKKTREELLVGVGGKITVLPLSEPNLDINGPRPVDVIVGSPKFTGMKKTLEERLASVEGENTVLPLPGPELDLGCKDLKREYPIDPSPKFSKRTLKELLGGVEDEITDLPLSGLELDIGFNDSKREYPIDPSLPDIKNGIYSTDEFRMYSFKIRPCSRAYSHDWTECPFVHPGENARRRDPRKFHYSCVPCPDFRKGTCRGGDMCEYAHGVFECWLHPAQYRTRLCKDGPGCNRRVCFFAHKRDELRPLFVSTGSVGPSPRSPARPSALDFLMSPGSGPVSSFTPPMSPNANGNWAQPNVTSLHLPGSNIQSSRLRSSLNARDIDQDLNFQLLNELNRQQRTNLTPTQLDDMFAAESLSPRFSDQPVFSPNLGFSPFQQQQGMLSPINTSFSPKNTPFLVQSPGRMSPRSVDRVDPMSPISSRVSMLARENQQPFRSLSSRELGSRSSGVMGSVDPWSKWGPGNEKPDWGMNVNMDEFGKLRRSSSFENGGINGDGPDLSWVQSLVKETTPEAAVAYGGEGGGSGGGGGVKSNSQIEQIDQSALSAWIEKMQL